MYSDSLARRALTISALLLTFAGHAVVAGASPASWTALVNATASGDTVQKVSGCGTCPDAGAISSAATTSVSFKVPAGRRLVAGLGRDTSASTSRAIDYAFSFSGSTIWEVRENGIYRTDGTFAATDVFTVANEGGTAITSQRCARLHQQRCPCPRRWWSTRASKASGRPCRSWPRRVRRQPRRRLRLRPAARSRPPMEHPSRRLWHQQRRCYPNRVATWIVAMQPMS